MKRILHLLVLGATLLVAAGACAPKAESGESQRWEPIGAPLPPSAASDLEGIAAEEADLLEPDEAPPLSGTGVSVQRMVIRTAQLDLIVSDTEGALEQIESVAQKLGGYVVSLDTYRYEEGTQGSVTLRVPADSFNEALQRLKALATTVRRESVSGQDVTEEYVNLESRLRHLRAKEEQLLEFLDEAEDTEAVLAVYEHLSATQQEIEQVTGQVEYLENQVALATISVDLVPDTLAQPLEVGGWNLPHTFRSAVEALLGALEFIVKACIYIAVLILPVLAMVAAPVVGLVFLIRWLVRRRRNRRRTA